MHGLGRRSVWLLAPALLFAAGAGCNYDFAKYTSTLSADQNDPPGGDAMPDSGANEQPDTGADVGRSADASMSEGGAREAGIADARTDVADADAATSPDAPRPATFYRAINVGGSDATALMIDGNNWEPGSTAPDVMFSGMGGGTAAVTNVPLMPSTDAARTSMIEHFLWGRPIMFTMSNIPSGSYLVYVYTWEDNGAQTFNVLVENKVVLRNYNSGPNGHWEKLGPWPVDVTSGTISISSSPNMGMAFANLCGVEIWQQ